jgi:diaminopimelate decarboxylase
MSQITDNIIDPAHVSQLHEALDSLIAESNSEPVANLAHIAHHYFEKKDRIIELTNNHKTPFYILDLEELHLAIDDFTSAFAKYLPSIKTYYAVKTNYHHRILQEIAKQKLGFDVSSSRELKLALEAGGTDILFTGPGKTVADLELALKHADKVVVNIDSFGELQRLGELADKKKIKIKAGVRIFTDVHGKWSKFGIPLQDLIKFWDLSQSFSYLNLCGIQFHISWNENAKPYEEIIKQLAEYLKQHFNSDELSRISFIDFGGGFRPYNSEGVHPWITPLGSVTKTLESQIDIEPHFPVKHVLTTSVPIETFAKGIANAIKTYLEPIISCEYFTEPGRIICNNAMHVVISVVDKKNENAVITDGGIHMVGWERFEFDYFPVLNMSRPSEEEKKCTIYGSLCMPQDLFGYYYYGTDIQEGDILMVPNQGHLTYSLAQNFIKDIPEVVVLDFVR